MNQPKGTMRAIALDQFGGPELLKLKDVPVPEIAPNEVLIRVEAAGVGKWDPFEREGGYAETTGMKPTFPYILGSEGAGTIALVGEQVENFKVGDGVYAPVFLNPKGGFYAEYAAVDADYAALIPDFLSIEQAGVMSGVGITALRGLDDTLHLQAGESILIFGASGGIGHIAVQLAQQMGARILAVTSGKDGVALAEKLGADMVIDGRRDNVVEAIEAFAPNGLDAALLTAGGETVQKIIQRMRVGGRVAYPNGIDPTPAPRAGVEISAYNGEPDPDIIKRFSEMAATRPFNVHVARTFPLEQAAEAHAALDEHYLGKLALRI